MIISSIKFFYLRDLNALISEINKYANDSDLWKVLPGTTNSAGNLVLHLVGNLRHFIGNEIGKSGYVRNRELEFTPSNLSKQQLVEMVEMSKKEVEFGMDQLSEADLNSEYPLLMGGNKYSTQHILIHLVAHLSYHLGQINYHRRTISTLVS
jgi:uncharacterized damage-inducible protein DinB